MRLGTELRRLRERAGLTTTRAAELLGTSSGQLSNIEVGRFGASADRVRAMAHNYSCTEQDLVEALVSMANDRTRGWWEEYRDVLPPKLLDLAELECHGNRLYAAHTVHVPGLLQTVDHAREIYRQAVPELTPPEIEHRVSYRIKRQSVLYRENPTPYHAVVHEAALRMRFGGTSVASAQLTHIATLSERDHVTVQVIPFEAGSYPGSGQSVYYVCGPVATLDTAQLDQSHGPVFIDSEVQLAQYRLLLARLREAALPPDASRDFIRSLARQM